MIQNVKRDTTTPQSQTSWDQLHESHNNIPSVIPQVEFREGGMYGCTQTLDVMFYFSERKGAAAKSIATFQANLCEILLLL